ncbi:MAG: TIGR03960 family B12-binding radical SAM protein [Candidatus Omnitrophica bacterium]|nr:TIGR03960 family B12-binding radical SAM protein [Candidatus Omnitrophota bacterium]
MIEDLLLQVNKPGRYIGQEWNTPRKDFDRAEVKFALCFPDLYEIGMSNLGMRIIYGILNNLSGVSCERFFSPDLDMEKILRAHRLEIFSLETKRRLREFDLVGFSLGHELDYTNALNILELGAVPLESASRDQDWPLIIGGGPCALNPEPMHEFFDLFILGEAEEAILEVVGLYQRHKAAFKAAKLSKQDLLAMFSRIEGVYAPSLYEVIYDNSGKIREFKPKAADIPAKIKKRFVRDLNTAFFPVDLLIPHIQIVHDRIALEIMRGCPNKCRFCQARAQYYPLRTRDADCVLNLASDSYKSTGYEEISLAGLSVSDYSGMEKLLERLVGLFKERAVSVSLPSIKPKTYLGGLSSLIATIKKTGLTFAPEAATERMRNILGKDFNEEDFFLAIEKAYASGYQRVKLYFMIGLPFEGQADLDAIVGFVNTVSELKKKVSRGPAQVNISINTLIPKPHTPFQWLGMEDMNSIEDKQNYLKGQVKKSLHRGWQERLKLSFHNRNLSFLEGVLSRGDRRLSRVIACAFKKGAKFDAWENHVRFDCWQAAFLECGIDPSFYLQARGLDEFLPWDFLDVGMDKEALGAEFKKSVAMK